MKSEKRSEAMRRRWADPEFRAKQIKRIRAKVSTEECRAKASAAGKRMWQDPEFRERMSEKQKRAARKRWQRKGEHEKASMAIKAALADPEVRKRMSIGTKRGLAKLAADPERAAKRSENVSRARLKYGQKVKRAMELFEREASKLPKPRFDGVMVPVREK